jgi:hypothetical protein
MDRTTQIIFRLDAIFDFSFGLLLLLAPFIGGVFHALDLPAPQPEIYMQLAGGLLLVCAYLLWISTGNPSLARPVALSIGLVNALGVVLLPAWVFFGNLGIGTLGKTILLAASAALLIFSAVELRYAWRTRR